MDAQQIFEAIKPSIVDFITRRKPGDILDLGVLKFEMITDSKLRLTNTRTGKSETWMFPETLPAM